MDFPDLIDFDVDILNSTLHYSLKHYGFIALNLSHKFANLVQLIKESEKYLKDDFVFSDSCKTAGIKEQFSMSSSSLQVGYTKSDALDEFQSYKDHYFYNPHTSTDFQYQSDILDRLFVQMHDLSIRLLEQLSFFLQVDKEYLLNSIEQDPLKDSHCLLKFNRYNNNNYEHTMLNVHFDLGLLTLIPVSSVPGLTIFQRKTSSWLNVERFFPSYTTLIVISGAQLERISGCIYPATLHKVCIENPETRISQIFFQRAEPHFVIQKPSVAGVMGFVEDYDPQSVQECNEKYLEKTMQTLTELDSVL